MKKKQIVIGILLLIGIVFALSLISSQIFSGASNTYSRSNVAYYPTFVPFQGDLQFPLFDRSMCEAGQDFILQVNPLGCEPSVVRSDLLEDQNVPVFCPIVATQLNPLIKIEAINNIIFSFAGPKPKEVVGVTYVPARAALGRYGAQLNQPVLNNIGYAVIVLRRQANESAMPEFILGNLTATIRYDVKNAFGVGRANFYLPELSDEQWEENFRQYGFWRGKGYLRADSIDNLGASISIYSDRETYGSGTSGVKRKLQTVNLNVGETSREIFMPGFNYCLGSMQVRLNGLENPNTRAKLRINEDVVEVKEGERFLENKCQVTRIIKNGVNEGVRISCREDVRRGVFDMTINPKINLKIEGKPIEVSVGDRLYQEIEKGKETEKSVYLAYVGTEGIGTAEQNLFIVTVSMPGQGEALTENVLNSIGGFVNRFPSSNIDNLNQLIKEGFKGAFSSVEKGLRFLSGQSFESVSFRESEKVFGKTLAIVGFAEAQDSDISSLSADVSNFYGKAERDYDTVIASFPQEESFGELTETLGEAALFSKIELAWLTGQKRTAIELCDEFRDSYPDSVVTDICRNAYKLSSTESAVRDVLIDGRTYRIVFDRIREPSLDEFSAEILVSPPEGSPYKITLRKNSINHLSKDEFIQLLDLRRDDLDREATATVRVNLQIERSTTEATKAFILGTSTKRLNKNFPESFGSKYKFTLLEVNLKKLAKVSINPKINYARTSVPFRFKIGIEKRGIQLSPEKTRERIESLNKTLEKWQDINGKLGTVVSSLKAACLGVGTTLTIKNFFSNLGGKGIARQNVMRGDSGWFEFCNKKESMATYGSVDSCLLDNSDAIDADIDIIFGGMEKQNQEFKTIREKLGKAGEDTEKVLKEYVDSDFNKELSDNLKGVFENDKIKIGNQDVLVSDAIARINSDTSFLTQARNLQLNSRLVNSENERIRAIARAEVKKELADIYVNTQRDVKRQTLEGEYGGPVIIGSTKKLKEYAITEVKTFEEVRARNNYKSDSIEDKEFVQKFFDESDGKEYLLTLNNNFIITQTYRINNDGSLTPVEEDNINPLGLALRRYDSTTYQNQFVNPRVRYYEVGIYAGFPAIVPFNVKEGWYAYVKPTTPIGGAIRAYDASGVVRSFWLCNVGRNGRAEFDSGIGDDTCEMINPGTNQPYNQFPGLDKSKSSSLAIKAVRAISDAERGYHDGVRKVQILGRSIQVGEPAIGIPDIQCQDFMSPTDCNLLFNVCDPVVCPSSRCDLGGAYPVKDVIQSGIAGSLALCLPNFPEVKIPICLSGVHAGIDGLLTVFDSYQQCLQASLDTGQTTGICDEINSIYMCDFFWRQSIPLAKIALTKGLGTVLGQNVRGGGEYLGVANAWDTASQSTGYFTQYYAANSFRAFKARSVEDVGTAVCKNFVSIAGPSGGNFFDALTTPDSPAQFYGRFDEIPFTTATVPPVSQYKVFYHIYAGKDFPAYYQVYLRGTGGSFYQDTGVRRIIAQGFIKAGDFFTETRDITAPSGYREMCIIVNGQEECGFKQVTTSFGVNYITEQYVASQAAQKDITSETACVSGTPSIYSLLSPNLQAGVTEVTNPAIYNRGITRICATANPGLGTDVLANTEKGRWQPVGNCGNTKIQCWLDTDSVKSTLRNTNLENEVLGKVAPNYIETLQKEGGFVEDFESLLEEIDSEDDNFNKINLISDNIDRVFFGSQKGYLTLLRGDVYADLAIIAFEKLKPEIDKIEEGEKTLAEKLQEGSITGEEAIKAGLISGFLSYPIFLFEDGVVFGQDFYYTYSGTEWHVSSNKNNLDSWLNVDEAYINAPEKEKKFLIQLKDKTYSDGLRLLIERTRFNDEGGFFDDAELYTERIKFTDKKLFIVTEDIITGEELYFKFDDNLKKWTWSFDIISWVLVPETESVRDFEKTKPESEFIDLIKNLEGKQFYDGAEIIFDIDSTFEGPREYIEAGESREEIKLTCSTSTECQQVLGKKIIELAVEIKQQRGIDDASVKADTGASSFECLVLQVAYTESRIRHCQGPYENNNPLYCENNKAEILAGDEGTSLGIMQINKNVHGEKLNFDENVNFGINLLINNHVSSSKEYVCNGKTYSGWTRALRGYNGWNTDCSKGNIRYVEDVIGFKDEIYSLFLECR